MTVSTVSGQNELSYLGVRAANPPNLIQATRAPVSTAGGDYQFPIGTLWVDTVGLAAYELVNVLGTTGTWVTTGGGGLAIATINNQAPVAGNFNMVGTANQITVTPALGQDTFTIPAAFITPGSIASTTSITSGTTLTATAGAITATNGNLVLGTAGNKIVSTSVATTTAAGANSFGKVTLVGGTATVATTAVTATSQIMLTRQTVGATGAAALGELSIGVIVAGTSFVINAWSQADATALAATDVSNIGWMIIN